LKHPLIISEIKSILHSKEYKDEFAKAALYSDPFYDEYQTKYSDLDPEKASDYDNKNNLKDHGDYVGCHNMQEPVDFMSMYENYIFNINPHRKLAQI
jgi:hypothetical protein